jgi:peptidoglycan/xylan/chitin deacetylase (PgdA/CDA1 family)
MLKSLQSIWEKNWPEIYCAATGSLPDFVLSRTPKPLGDSVPVFCYHTVSGADFESDLIYLAKNGYDTITADALLTHLERQAPLDQPSVVLTFDDCSQNFFQVVFPLLQKFGRQSVAFVATHFHDLAETAGNQGQRPCTWEEMAIMRDSGLVDFQSHSHEHRYFPRWPEPVPLCGASKEMNNAIPLKASRSMSDDLLLSKTVLEQRLGTIIRHLAFPRYDGTEEAIRIGKKLGYEGFWCGVLPGRQTNRPGDSPDRIARISGEFLRRLPGRGRASLRNVLTNRYLSVLCRVGGMGR